MPIANAELSETMGVAHLSASPCSDVRAAFSIDRGPISQLSDLALLCILRFLFCATRSMYLNARLSTPFHKYTNVSLD